MPALTIDIPPEHHDDLLRESLSVYAVKADALHDAVGTYLRDEESLNPVLGHRSELATIDAIIQQLGWQLNTHPVRTRLTSDSRLLGEISRRGALDAVITEFGDDLSAATADAGELDAISRWLRRVTTLFALLQAVYRPANPEAS